MRSGPANADSRRFAVQTRVESLSFSLLNVGITGWSRWRVPTAPDRARSSPRTRLGAASQASLTSSSLTREGDTLVLSLDKDGAQLMGDVVRVDLENLAGWLGLDAEIRISEQLPARQI